VKSKDYYENISGIEMRPCVKKQVKMCAKTTRYVLKNTKKGLQIDSKCIINVKKTKYPTSKDNNSKILTSERKDHYENIS